MNRVKRRLTSLLVVSLVFGCVAAGAQAASTSVVAAIKGQDKVVKQSAAYRSLTHVQVKTTAQARQLIVEFEALRHKVEHAATVVAHASAVGAKQKRGQHDWVIGVRDLARGIGQFDAGMTDAVDGRTAAGKALLTQAQSSIKVADELGAKGDRLLGIPTSY